MFSSFRWIYAFKCIKEMYCVSKPLHIFRPLPLSYKYVLSDVSIIERFKVFENRRNVLLENVAVEDLDIMFHILGRWPIFFYHL